MGVGIRSGQRGRNYGGVHTNWIRDQDVTLGDVGSIPTRHPKRKVPPKPKKKKIKRINGIKWSKVEKVNGILKKDIESISGVKS